MSGPQELSIAEIRQYMLDNGGKVTNHALVKHFKRFLTHPQSQNEARKQFKTYVNILSTIKNENNQKYLLLRKRYFNECPTEDAVERAVAAAAAETMPSSPGAISLTSENSSLLSESGLNSPASLRQPPPYKPPPEVSANPSARTITSPITTTGASVNQENMENYRDCVNEFEAVVRKIDPSRLARQPSIESEKEKEESQEKAIKEEAAVVMRGNSVSRSNSSDDQTQNKENIPRFSFSSGNSGTSLESSAGDKVSGADTDTPENPMSVKEATRKFNRMASEEEAKIISPSSKKKPEKQTIEEKDVPEVNLSHKKAKEWLVSMARASYHELAKLANEYPELVKLQDPSTYTALHWAAKHGNKDIVKLIAGTYKADVNARTNGGYTPLHLAMQFGRADIFELLCNVYKANRDLMDWSGNKPLDYSNQRTSVSAQTYSKIKAKRKPAVEKDSGFLRIGSLNVRVKKTTEAFSNFLGVGNGNGSSMAPQRLGAAASLPHYGSHRHHHHHPAHGHRHHRAGMTRSHLHPTRATTTMTTGTTCVGMPATMTMTKTTPLAATDRMNPRASVPNSSGTSYDLLHKSWGSADNIPQGGMGCGNNTKDMMPPPKHVDVLRKRQLRASQCSSFASNATDSPRDSISSSNSSSNLNSGYSSMPTTPNQLRAPIGIGLNVNNQLGDSDSDSACGFGSNWSMNGRNSISSGNLQTPRFN